MSVSTTHEVESLRSAQFETNSSSDGAGLLTPASGSSEVPEQLSSGTALGDALAEWCDAKILEMLRPLEERIAAEAQETSKRNVEMDRLADAFKNLQAQDAQQKEEIASLQTERTQHREQIANLQEELAQQSERIAEIQTERTQQKGQIVSPQRQLNSQKAGFQALIDHVDKKLGRTRFIPNDFGFFEPSLMQEVEHGGVINMGTTNYFADVESFIDAAEVAQQKLSVEIVQQNLHRCLLGSAREWYYSILSEGERDTATRGEDLAQWFSLLRRKWGHEDTVSPSNVDHGFGKLDQITLTQESLEQSGGSTTAFFMSVVRAGREVGMDTTFSQLSLAYLRMAPDVQRAIGQPMSHETLNKYIIRADRGVERLFKR
ncbi:hypothetical protein HDK77DRAFT_429380 [Phyllosticta capitalensis]